jgi:hypothetical protein
MAEPEKRPVTLEELLVSKSTAQAQEMKEGRYPFCEAAGMDRQ